MSFLPPVLDRTALFGRLAEGAGARVTVVTPNRRLAAALRLAFDEEQARAGRERWESPDILPWTAFVERQWDEARHAPGGEGAPLLLAAPEEEALWESVVAESRHARDLASAGGAASLAREAWQLLHAWRLGPALARAEANEDTKAFREWSARYERLTRERGLVDGARLPDVLAGRLAEPGISRPATIILHAFDRLAPQQGALLAVFEATGSSLLASEPCGSSASPVRTEWKSPRLELEACAAWARDRLEAVLARGRIPRIGVVVPDLGRNLAAVERAFSAALHPASAVPGGEPAARAFELSLGRPLDEVPVVHDALALVELLGPETDFEKASRVLRSPFLAGSISERAARARVDARVRERAGTPLSLDRLAALLGAGGAASTPGLATLLERLAAFRKERLFGQQSAPDWARAFAEALAIAGWPGERSLDSATFQAVRKWHEALAGFARLERVAGRMGFREARSRLARLAAGTLFQPESPDVPVMVMGILESAGMEFDHLWVSGLTDEAWPLPARPNPFLPVSVQRAAGIPEADATGSLELDRRLTQGWLRAAPEVVLSHARTQGEAELSPSPLVAAIALGEVSLGSHRPDWRATIHGARRTQPFADERGPALAGGEGLGGTAIFRDQAACPFRAFAAHRLASKAPESPQPGLTAAERGTLLHHVLAETWGVLRDKGTLDATDDAKLEEILGRAAESAMDRLRRRRPHALEGRFARVERRRLVELAHGWLALERTRGDFEVLATERVLAVSFGGVSATVKLDRLDRLEAGGEAILDYKTGEASVGAWLGPRPDEPQLPMYALACGEDVAAIAFARVKAGEHEFKGLARAERLLPKVTTVTQNRTRLAKNYADWSRLVDSWRGELESLGRAFAAGEARLDPKRGAVTCEGCAQALVCRVAERPPAAGGEEADDA